MKIETIYFNIQLLGIMTDGIWKMNGYFVMSFKLSERRYNRNIVTLRAFTMYRSDLHLDVVKLI